MFIKKDQKEMNKEIKYPQIIAISNINGTLYFKSYNSPGTFMLEEGSDSLRVIQEMEKPYVWHEFMYSDCVKYENMLVFVPYVNAEFITILDTQSLKFLYVRNVGGYRYKKAIVYENGIYMFGEPCDGGKRMMLDMHSLDVKNVIWKGDSADPAIMFDNGCQINNKVYWPQLGYGEICTFDFENKTSKTIQLKNVEMPILTICFDGEYFWLSGIGDNILIWDEKENEIVEVIQLEKTERNSPWNMRFSTSKILGEYIYFSPVFYKKMIRIHLKSRKIEELFEVGNDEVCWNICEIGNDSIYVDITNYKEGGSRNYIIAVDGKIKDNNIEFSIQNCYFQENIFESSNNSLEVFINYLASSK